MFQESPFTGACAASTWEVLLMLFGTLLLGVLLGYLIWGWVRNRVYLLEKKVREVQHIADLKDSKIVSLNTRIQALEADLGKKKEEVRTKETQYGTAINRIKSLTEELENLKSPVKTKEKSTTGKTTLVESKPIKSQPAKPQKATSDKEDKASKASNPLRTGSTKASLAVAKEVFGKKVSANDLKLIEGIGPKIESILKDKGIKTWAKLAQARLPELREILEDAGSRYRLHDPKTWPRQSRMAAKGEWKKLAAYQDTLKGGR